MKLIVQKFGGSSVRDAERRAGGLRVSRRFGSCLVSWSGGFGSGGSWRFLTCYLRLRQLRLFDRLGLLRPLGKFGLGTKKTERISTIV